MKNKIMKFFGVTLFSCTVLLLLGSVPKQVQKTETFENKEFTNINNSAKIVLPSDFDTIIQKNPAILLEITVE